MKNYGLDLAREEAELKGDEWVFGAQSSTCLFAVPEIKREIYLPLGEIQNKGEEKSYCVTAAYLNILETKFNFAYQTGLISKENKKWLEDNGYVVDGRVVFSDTFNALLSGTTRQGNSLKAPVESIRKDGLIPKSKLPQLDSFELNYNKDRIVPELTQLGQDFLKRFTINYEQVSVFALKNALLNDSVAIAVYAWANPIDGVYPRSDLPINHCVMAYAPQTFIFDNYFDQTDGDFIKVLAEDYAIYQYGYRVYVSAQNNPIFDDLPDSQKVPLFTWLAQMLAWIFTKKGTMPAIPKEILPEKPVEQKETKPTVPVKESKLDNWADAIEFFESGGDKNSVSYQRNNPGNCKGKDGKFLVFATYEAGRAYLMNYLIRAATNEHQAYVAKAAGLRKTSSGHLTIREFIEVYTSGDSAEIQKNYADCIARYCNVPVETRIVDLL